jgi:hypothetical protein
MRSGKKGVKQASVRANLEPGRDETTDSVGGFQPLIRVFRINGKMEI